MGWAAAERRTGRASPTKEAGRLLRPGRRLGKLLPIGGIRDCA